MGRLRIYAGTGKPVYDSEGPPADRTVDRIKTEYNRGVAFFCDPAEGIIRGQVSLRRHGPEQFVAAYTSDAEEDLIPAFTDAVKKVSEKRGWPILTDTGGNQAVFDVLASGDAFSDSSHRRVREQFQESPLSVERLKKELTADRPVILKIPDYLTAARTLGFVTREFDEDYVVSITESTDVPTIQSSDLLLRPSGQVETIGPGERLQEQLRSEQVEAATTRVETTVEALQSELRTRSAPTSDVMFPVLTRALDESDVRIALVKSESRQGPREAIPWFLGTAGSTVLTASLLTLVVPLQGVSELLIAGGTISIVGTGALLLGYASPAGFEAQAELDSQGFRDTSLDSEIDQLAAEVIESFRVLNEICSHEQMEKHLSEVLEANGIEVVDQQALERRRKSRKAVGVVVGIIFGLFIFYVAKMLILQL